MQAPLQIAPLALQGDKMLNRLKESGTVRQLDLPSLAIKGTLSAMVTAGSLLVLAVGP